MIDSLIDLEVDYDYPESDIEYISDDDIDLDKSYHSSGEERFFLNIKIIYIIIIINILLTGFLRDIQQFLTECSSSCCGIFIMEE